MTNVKSWLRDHFYVAAASAAVLLPPVATATARNRPIDLLITFGMMAAVYSFGKLPKLINEVGLLRDIATKTARKNFGDVEAAPPDLQKVVDDYRERTNFKRPLPLYITASEAYRRGAARHSTGLYIGKDLVESCTRDELKAIIVHEISHERTNDAGIGGAITAAKFTTAAAFIHAAGEQIFSKPDSTGMLYATCMAALGVLAYGYQKAVESQLNKFIEYRADGGAVRFLGNPEAVANALSVVELLNAVEYDDTPDAKAVVHDLAAAVRRNDGSINFQTTQSGWKWLTASHPGREQRIANIKSMAAPA